GCGSCAPRPAPDPQAQLEGAVGRGYTRLPVLRRIGDSSVMETFPDLGSLTDQELKDLIQQMTEEEIEISYKRRILHGKIDILRVELVNRLRRKHEGGEEIISGADVDKLTEILSGRVPGTEES